MDGCIYIMTSSADEYCFKSTCLVIHYGREVSEIPLALDYAINHVEHGYPSSL
jgi:hypothetical protein